MLVVGVDPGFASMGYALLELQSGYPVFVGAGVIRTRKSTRKVLSCDDNFERTAELYRELKRRSGGALLFAVEAESWTRMPSDKLIGLARGALYGLATEMDVPLEQYSPQDVKDCIEGKRSASKQDIERTMLDGHVELGAYLDALPKGQRQHASDAAACAYTALKRSTIVRFYFASRSSTRRGNSVKED